MQKIFSYKRLIAIIKKEYLQTIRDKTTFAMMIGIPIIQLTLFGFAINTNPQNLPTALVSDDNTPLTRQIIDGLINTKYFNFIPNLNYNDAQKLLFQGKIQFIFYIPNNFTRSLLRDELPHILLEADATDPLSTSNVFLASAAISQKAFINNSNGILNSSLSSKQPFSIDIHPKYNPLSLNTYNIIPGLLGVILTLTLVITTSLSMTREYERGTLENLLATPVKPIEVIVGKILPYIFIGYVQVVLIILAAYYIFHIPIKSNLTLLFMVCFPFISANLSVGMTISTIAKNQLQAMQMAIFYFLPSLLLSGFMFPFRGMPTWAQFLGDLLPLTHFLRICRGVILKNNLFADISSDLWAIVIFALFSILICLFKYKQTLD